MFNLEQAFFSNTLRLWLIAASVGVISYLLLTFLRTVVLVRLRKISENTNNVVDDFIVSLLEEIRHFFLLIVSAFLATSFLEFSTSITSIIRSIAILALIFQVWFWGNHALKFFVRYFVKKDGEIEASKESIDGMMPAFLFLGRLVLLSLLLLLALDNFGFDVTTLVASLGVGGIAVALAVQNILGDLFSSLSIVLDKPFVVGDFIVVGEFSGNVEKIGLKTTRVRSLSGEQLVFSNSDLLSSRVRNYKRMRERRILFHFGVTYQTSSEQLKAIPALVKQLIDAEKNARFDRAHFYSFGASSLDFEVVYYVTVPDYAAYMDVQQRINLGLFERLESEKIEFAYPTQTLHLETAKELLVEVKK